MADSGTCDYLVVGAGSAGCVLASRLSEDPANRVVLLEAGGPDRGALLSMPLRWFEAMRTARLDWGYASEPEPCANLRRIPAPRGRVLGGSGSVNGMMYSRGHPSDYDSWSGCGVAGWSFADVLPYFRKSEANWRGASQHHGAEGPLTVAAHKTDGVIYPRLMETARRLGLRVLEDFHGPEQEGFSAPDFTVHRGRRASTSVRYLRPAVARPNLTVVLRALATRIVLESGRAVAVEFVENGQTRVLRAEREVILCAGTFNSPQLLLLSGIGPADELRESGITPAVDLPGVGRNLQDHASIGLVFDASQPITFDRELRLDRMTLSLARWWIDGSGVVGGLPVGAQGFVRTLDTLSRPDLQMLVSPVAMDARVWFPGWRASRGHRYTVSNVLLHPQSTGTVRLRSPDPTAKPRIQFNLLASPDDRAAFRRFIRFTRHFLGTEPASSLIARELVPGTDVSSDDQIDDFVRSRIGTAMHPVGTCAMGTGPSAVLDSQLRVIGVDGLRVVDCASMPQIVGGNTNAPAIMIAERGADFILGRTQR